MHEKMECKQMGGRKTRRKKWKKRRKIPNSGIIFSFFFLEITPKFSWQFFPGFF